MSRFEGFENERRRQIYEYVERQGAVEPETVRRDLLVQPETSSKPARSGAELAPSVPMPTEEFDRHVSILERDGYLEEQGDKLRVAHPVEDDSTTVELDEAAATVRPGRQEDIGDILDVIETIASEDGYVVANRLADEVARDEVLLRHNEREDRIFFVANVLDDESMDEKDESTAERDEPLGESVGDGETVGWLHVEAVQWPMMGHTAQLTVGVLEEYRGDGLGSTLMDRGLEWARDRGLRKVYQNLPATNERAIAFLDAEGWSVESTREGHYLIGDELVDEIQLAIWLDESHDG